MDGGDLMIKEVSTEDGNVELRDGRNGEDGMAGEDGVLEMKRLEKFTWRILRICCSQYC